MPQPIHRAPSLALLVVRVVVIAVLGALLTFCVSLFLGILGIVLFDVIARGGINLASAYRDVAVPAAGFALVVALCVAVAVESRYYRRALAQARSETLPEM